MAVFTGKNGVVQNGANAIAEVRSYSLSQTADTAESTSMGDSAKTYEATLTDFSGTIDVYFDDTDTNGQVAMTVGSSITLNLAPDPEPLFVDGTLLYVVCIPILDPVVFVTGNVKLLAGVAPPRYVPAILTLGENSGRIASGPCGSSLSVITGGEVGS